MGRVSYWKKRAIKDLKRKEGIRGRPKDVFLIICEGEKTEPNYFEAFRLPKNVMVVKGIGAETKRLVTEAIKEKKEAKKYGIEFDQVWCVFDRDSFPKENFNEALRSANENGIKVAYSNEAFEIWYLLHFDYIVTPLNREQYEDRLSNKLGRTYKKNSLDMHENLLDKQAIAIQNAKRLLSNYSPLNPAENNPSTTVFKLVEELNRFLSP